MMKWFVVPLFFAMSHSFAQSSNDNIPYLLGDSIQHINFHDLEEISGIALGKTYPERIYAHNDSGGEPKIFVLDTLGNRLGEILLEGVANRDWEEIAVGPDGNGSSSVYIGEIGDNLAQHGYIEVYRFTEPTELNQKVIPEKVRLTYPDGPMDAEAMIVDPISGELFIFSKRDEKNTVFTMGMDAFQQGEAVLTKVGNLPFTGAVAADISKDGSQILIKTYFMIYYWGRNEDETVMEALSRNPVELPYSPEPQGEAIGFNADASAFYTLSEKRFEFIPVLYRYPANHK